MIKTYIKILLVVTLILAFLMPISTAEENTTVTDSTETVVSTPESVTTTDSAPREFRLAPSVSLTSTKNTVEQTDPAILTLSMINPSVNDVNLNVDVILKAPSGVYVTATTFASSGSNQNIGHFSVRPGEEQHITIQITSTENGEKAIESQVIYYPDENKIDYHMLQQTMSVFVKERSKTIETKPIEQESTKSEQKDDDSVTISTPGFSMITAFIGLVGVVLLMGRRREL